MAEAYTPHNVHHDGRPHKQAVKLSWETYFRTGIFSDWQRLMYDLGFTKPFYSKTQCRKALDSVWVNIVDFLEAVGAGVPVRRFQSRNALVRYTQKHHRYYPKQNIPKGSPLRGLMKHM